MANHRINAPRAGSREALQFLNKLLIKEAIADPILKLKVEDVVDALERLREGQTI